MKTFDKGQIQLAESIRDRLQKSRQGHFSNIQYQLLNLATKLYQIERIGRQLGMCASRGWTAAGERLVGRLESLLSDLPYTLGDIQRTVASRRQAVPTTRELLAELDQIREELGGFRHDRESDELAVETEHIELEGIHLGRFEIRVRIAGLSNTPGTIPYRIEALDPCPAGSNELVTHPHVNDEQLCPGDAGAAIQGALSGGRLCDFFQLVCSVLTHYNPDSPYVSLDSWDGQPCHDCGYTPGEDNAYWCESCEHQFCEECTGYCHGCDRSLCNGCLSSCPSCGDSQCESCLETCPQCGGIYCASCLEENLCPTCLEEENVHENQEDDQEEQNDEIYNNTTTTGLGVSIEAGGGQAPAA